MKTKRTRKVFHRWATVNPNYPEAHTKLFETRRVCDCTYGRKWSRRCTLIVERIVKQ